MPEETLLAAGRQPFRDVDERRRQEHAVLDDHDLAALLDDEQAPRAVGRVRDLDRAVEPETTGVRTTPPRRRSAAGADDEQQDEGHRGHPSDRRRLAGVCIGR